MHDKNWFDFNDITHYNDNVDEVNIAWLDTEK